MITLFTYGTPHGHRASVALEEFGLPYRVHRVQYEAGTVLDDALGAVSPLRKFPAIEIVEAGEARSIFGSGAILLHLAETTGRFLPSERTARDAALSWLILVLTDLTPALIGQFRFGVLAPEPQPYAVAAFEKDVGRCLAVLEKRLTETPYLTGAEYGVVDMAAWPFIDAGVATPEIAASHPHLARWHRAVGERPAVQRGMAVPG